MMASYWYAAMTILVNNFDVKVGLAKADQAYWPGCRSGYNTTVCLTLISHDCQWIIDHPSLVAVSVIVAYCNVTFGAIKVAMFRQTCNDS